MGSDVSRADFSICLKSTIHTDVDCGVETMRELHGIPSPVLRPRWKAWLARLFGKRIETHDEEFVMVSYQWRGTLWVWSWEPKRV